MRVRTTQLAKKLVSIRSVNPPGTNDRIASYVSSYLSEHGLRIRQQRVGASRYNVIAYTHEPSECQLVLSGHLDTFSIKKKNKWTRNPFGVVTDGKLYGRGACDMKGGVAAMMDAAIAAKREGLDRGVALALTCDEEIGFRGVETILHSKKKVLPAARWVVVGEPTNMQLCPYQRGLVKFSVKIAAEVELSHTSLRVSESNNPLVIASRIVNQFTRNVPKIKHKAGPFSVNIEQIKGGGMDKDFSDGCEIIVEYWIVPPYTPDDAERMAREITRKMCEGTKFMFEIHRLKSRSPISIPTNSKVVTHAKQVLETRGLNARLHSFPGMSEAEPYHLRGGLDAVVLGPGDLAQAHGYDEFIELSAIENARDAFKDLIVSMCRDRAASKSDGATEASRSRGKGADSRKRIRDRKAGIVATKE